MSNLRTFLCVNASGGCLTAAESERCFAIFKDCTLKVMRDRLFGESHEELAVVAFGKHGAAANIDELLADEVDPLDTSVPVAAPFGCALVSKLERVGWESLERTRRLLNFCEARQPQPDLSAALTYCANLARHDRERIDVAKRRVSNLSYRVLLFTGAGNLAGFDEISTQLSGEQLTVAQLPVKFVVPDGELHNARCKTALDGIRSLLATLERDQVLDSSAEDELWALGEAEAFLANYIPKSTRAVPWRACLEISPELGIACDVFIATREAKFQHRWSVVKPATAESCTTYLVGEDEERKEVPPESITRGYRYGATVVPVENADRRLEFHETGKSFSLISFCKRDDIKLQYLISDAGTRVVLPRCEDRQAIEALTAFAQALKELDSVALVRYAYNAKSSPQVACIMVHDQPESPLNGLELLLHFLPFAEDMQSGVFPSFDSLPASMQPTDEQLDAVGQFIESSRIDDDDEYGYDPTRACNPVLQKIYSLMQHRAMNDVADLPKYEPSSLSALFAEPIKPEKEIDLRSAFQLEKVEPLRVAGKAMGKQAVATAADSKPSLSIGAHDPLADIRHIVGEAKRGDYQALSGTLFARIADALLATINRLQRPDGDEAAKAKRATDAMLELRQLSIRYSQGSVYNAFVRSLRDSNDDVGSFIAAGDASGGRLELLKPISSSETPSSAMTPADANAFWKAVGTTRRNGTAGSSTAGLDEEVDIFDRATPPLC